LLRDRDSRTASCTTAFVAAVFLGTKNNLKMEPWNKTPAHTIDKHTFNDPHNTLTSTIQGYAYRYHITVEDVPLTDVVEPRHH
jgi:hypothetical protein